MNHRRNTTSETIQTAASYAIIGAGIYYFFKHPFKGCLLTIIFLAVVGSCVVFNVKQDIIESAAREEKETKLQAEKDKITYALTINELYIKPAKSNIYNPPDSAKLIRVFEFENTTDQKVIAFKGKMVICDDFGKEKSSIELFFKHPIPAKSKVILAQIGENYLNDSKLIAVSSITELNKILPLPYETLKVDTDVIFYCSDIRYEEIKEPTPESSLEIQPVTE